MRVQSAIIVALTAATAIAVPTDTTCKKSPQVINGECYYLECATKIAPIEEGGNKLYTEPGKSIVDCAKRCSPDLNDCVFAQYNANTKTCTFFGGEDADYEDYNLYSGKPRFSAARWVPDPEFC